MKRNYILVGLDYDFIKNVAQKLTTDLNLYFLDVNDLIEYCMVNSGQVKDVCGLEYYEKEQKKIVQSATDYENTIINFPYSLILNDEYFKLLNNSFIIFVDLDKTMLEEINKNKQEDNNLTIELLTHAELTTLLKQKANWVVSGFKNQSEYVEELKKLKIFALN